MRFPDAYIIGAPKCGAATLARCLSGHPDVFLPETGQSHVFARDLDLHRMSEAVWRKSYERRPETVLLDHSDWYLFSETAVPEILARRPDARFLLALDNPADMAWALHASNLAEGIEHIEDFGVAWAMSHARSQKRGCRSRIDPRILSYRQVCSLGAQTTRLLTHIDPSQLHLVFLDDMRTGAGETLAGVQDFLGIASDPDTPCPIEDCVEERPAGSLQRALHRVHAWARNRISERHARSFLRINALDSRRGTLLEMPLLFRQKVCDTLAEDIATLAALSGRDLSIWIS